jgi:hypothetical protein
MLALTAHGRVEVANERAEDDRGRFLPGHRIVRNPDCARHHGRLTLCTRGAPIPRMPRHARHRMYDTSVAHLTDLLTYQFQFAYVVSFSDHSLPALLLGTFSGSQAGSLLFWSPLSGLIALALARAHELHPGSYSYSSSPRAESHVRLRPVPRAKHGARRWPGTVPCSRNPRCSSLAVPVPGLHDGDWPARVRHRDVLTARRGCLDHARSILNTAQPD